MQNIDNLKGHHNITVTRVIYEYYCFYVENGEYYLYNGPLKSIKYVNSEGQISRLPLKSNANRIDYIFPPLFPDARMGSRPAIIVFDRNGNLEMTGYLINGKLHREDGPAYVNFLENRKSYYLNDIQFFK